MVLELTRRLNTACAISKAVVNEVGPPLRCLRSSIVRRLQNARHANARLGNEQRSNITAQRYSRTPSANSDTSLRTLPEAGVTSMAGLVQQAARLTSWHSCRCFKPFLLLSRRACLVRVSIQRLFDRNFPGHIQATAFRSAVCRDATEPRENARSPRWSGSGRILLRRGQPAPC